MTLGNIFLVALLLIYLVLDIYVFRFQRTTLSLSRLALGAGRAEFQILLTPTWVGVVGWVSTGLFVLNLVTLFLWVAWWAPLLLILYASVGGALIDVVTPFPSYTHCFNVIEKHLDRESNRARKNDGEKLKAVESLRQLVRSARSEYKV